MTDNLTAICEAIVYRKCWSLGVSQPYGPLRSVTWIVLPFLGYNPGWTFGMLTDTVSLSTNRVYATSSSFQMISKLIIHEPFHHLLLYGYDADSAVEWQTKEEEREINLNGKL
jgi:hypothetical protein